MPRISPFSSSTQTSGTNPAYEKLFKRIESPVWGQESINMWTHSTSPSETLVGLFRFHQEWWNFWEQKLGHNFPSFYHFPSSDLLIHCHSLHFLTLIKDYWVFLLSTKHSCYVLDIWAVHTASLFTNNKTQHRREVYSSPVPQSRQVFTVWCVTEIW